MRRARRTGELHPQPCGRGAADDAVSERTGLPWDNAGLQAQLSVAVRRHENPVRRRTPSPRFLHCSPSIEPLSETRAWKCFSSSPRGSSTRTMAKWCSWRWQTVKGTTVDNSTLKVQRRTEAVAVRGGLDPGVGWLERNSVVFRNALDAIVWMRETGSGSW